MDRHGERGAAAVEFALVLPVLVVLLFGIIEFGFILYSKEVLTNASREGTRAGIVQAVPKPTVGQIQGVVTNYISNTGVLGTWTTTVTGAGGAFGANLTVTVTLPYNYLVLPNFTTLTGPLTLTATTVMRHE